MVNSKKKGSRGELEFVNWLKAHSINARRTQQYCGANNDADIVSDLRAIHFEIKRVEKLNISKAIQQSKEDAKADQYPVVVHRRSREKWLVTMDAEDWLELIDRRKAVRKGIQEISSREEYMVMSAEEAKKGLYSDLNGE